MLESNNRYIMHKNHVQPTNVAIKRRSRLQLTFKCMQPDIWHKKPMGHTLASRIIDIDHYRISECVNHSSSQTQTMEAKALYPWDNKEVKSLATCTCKNYDRSYHWWYRSCQGRYVLGVCKSDPFILKPSPPFILSQNRPLKKTT